MSQLPPLKSSSYGRWMMIAVTEVAALGLVLTGLAFAYDDVWLHWREKPPVAVCGLFRLVPWTALPNVGLVLMLFSVVLMVGKQRVLGVILLPLGAVAFELPELFIPDWLAVRCPELFSGST